MSICERWLTRDKGPGTLVAHKTPDSKKVKVTGIWGSTLQEEIIASGDVKYKHLFRFIGSDRTEPVHVLNYDHSIVRELLDKAERDYYENPLNRKSLEVSFRSAEECEPTFSPD